MLSLLNREFPDTLGVADGPAALEPNGKILMTTSPLIFQSPATFFEWNGRELTEVAPAPNAAIDSSFYSNFLVLPAGQIMFSDFFFVSVYNPKGETEDAPPPHVTSAPDEVRPGRSYVVEGYVANGIASAPVRVMVR